jgi:hypothetical protein
MTLRGRPVRRPVVVRRSVPQRPGLGRHSPSRPPVTRWIVRWVDQARRMMKRGGSRGPRSRLSATRSSPSPEVPGAWSGCERAVGTRRSLWAVVPGRHLGPRRQSTGVSRAVGPESGPPGPARLTSPATWAPQPHHESPVGQRVGLVTRAGGARRGVVRRWVRRRAGSPPRGPRRPLRSPDGLPCARHPGRLRSVRGRRH